MVILTTMIGFTVLVLGREFLWVFIAGLGFALGVIYGGQYYSGQPDWVILLVSALIALIGALLAYTLQRLTAGIAGFGTGWYITNLTLGYAQINLRGYDELAAAIVGILVAALVMLFYDWGVMIFSSFAGAAIIVSGTSFARQVQLILLVALAFLGFLIQTILFIRHGGHER